MFGSAPHSRSTFILIGWYLMVNVLYPFRIEKIPGGREMIESEVRKLGRMSQAEKMVTPVFSAGSRWASAPIPMTLLIPAAFAATCASCCRWARHRM